MELKSRHKININEGPKGFTELNRNSRTTHFKQVKSNKKNIYSLEQRECLA